MEGYNLLIMNLGVFLILITFFIGGDFPGIHNSGENYSFRYTFSYHPKIAEDMSIFIQYYYGQDYYNIHFNENISILRTGLMTDQLEF
jgi:hypothetical protein